MEPHRKPEATIQDVRLGLASLKRIADEIYMLQDRRIDPWLESIKRMEDVVAEINKEFVEMYRVLDSNDPIRRNNFHMRLTESLNDVLALKEMGVEMFLERIPEDKLKRFSREDLNSFTSQPPHQIGSGGFGKVYKGQFSENVRVAIKVLIPKDVTEEIFMIEVSSMLKTSHPNIVKLHGFCSDANMKALVYEFMEKGSLDVVLLQNPDSVKWRAVYAVTIEIAKALAYLHNDNGDNSDQIIHHDIKPSNVLLDRHLSPKVTDFGATRIMNKNVSHFTMTHIRGTCGYTAPEMTLYSSRVTCKCDVFSFGMILFDVLRMGNNTESQSYFPNQVWDNVVEGQLNETIQECNIGEENRESAMILSKVALWCIQFTPERRPSMTDVVNALEKEMQVPRPPNPFYPCEGNFSIQQSQDVIYSPVSPSTNARYLNGERPNHFSHADLNSFTANFSNPIDRHGNVNVYKGQFPSGVQIVVKQLIGENADENESIAQVNKIFETTHRNLIKIYGYCFERNMKALVYQYMPNGSLDNILFDTRRGNLEWEKLYEIATETAKGVSYLHDGCDEPLLHLDLKASNVLLDSNMCPKVSNFGVFKLVNRGKTHLTVSKVRGDPSYAAPEMIQPSVHLTHKSDVYSFGMMLLEVLGRRRTIKGKVYFPKLIWDKFQNQKFEEIRVECGIKNESREKAMILCMVAFWCIQYTPENRPSMSIVVKMLEKNLKVMKPPYPFSPSQAYSVKSFVDVVYDPSDFGTSAR